MRHIVPAWLLLAQVAACCPPSAHDSPDVDIVADGQVQGSEADSHPQDGDDDGTTRKSDASAPDGGAAPASWSLTEALACGPNILPAVVPPSPIDFKYYGVPPLLRHVRWSEDALLTSWVDPSDAYRLRWTTHQGALTAEISLFDDVDVIMPYKGGPFYPTGGPWAVGDDQVYCFTDTCLRVNAVGAKLWQRSYHAPHHAARLDLGVVHEGDLVVPTNGTGFNKIGRFGIPIPQPTALVALDVSTGAILRHWPIPATELEASAVAPEEYIGLSMDVVGLASVAHASGDKLAVAGNHSGGWRRRPYVARANFSGGWEKVSALYLPGITYAAASDLQALPPANGACRFVVLLASLPSSGAVLAIQHLSYLDCELNLQRVVTLPGHALTSDYNSARVDQAMRLQWLPNLGHMMVSRITPAGPPGKWPKSEAYEAQLLVVDREGNFQNSFMVPGKGLTTDTLTEAVVTEASACRIGVSWNNALYFATPWGQFDAKGAGICATLSATDCSDGNDCSIDGCDPTKGCTHVPLPDGANCGVGATCSGGTCGG